MGRLLVQSLYIHYFGLYESLPIPALDGGHALFTIYEMINAKTSPEKFLQYAADYRDVVAIILDALCKWYGCHTLALSISS